MAGGARDPEPDCARCPRLVEYRTQNRAALPAHFNQPVPSFGSERPRILIVGLAPGLNGANRTGRPFTGDFAGDLLYDTLHRFGLSSGTYGREADDGLRLTRTRITNAVRCVPPANKPLPAEIDACRSFLAEEIKASAPQAAILALGRIAHDSVVRAVGARPARCAFAHGAVHALPDGRRLYDSYHCSRYNTNTGRLTAEMFQAVFAAIQADLTQPEP